MVRVYLSILILFFCYYVNAGIYKCIDGKGEVSYQSIPCSGSMDGYEVDIKMNEASSLDVRKSQPLQEANAYNLEDEPVNVEGCDAKLYGRWKAEWLQVAPDGQKSKFGIGDMRWTFLRDNSFKIYSDGFTNPNKLKFSCVRSKIAVINAETNKELSVVHIISITPSKLVTLGGMGRYTHWNRM